MASSSSRSHSSNYAVFLSFRGEDTRKTFVDHFYSNLMNRGILTYKDDETLRQGEFISPSLFNAIERSQIALPIFSKNYADSSWCLEELTHIMNCKDEGKLIVIPIFYGVVPSNVRKQEGDFGKGFAKQKARNINKVEIWRSALIRACDIAGWEIQNMANGHESRAINEIVDKISNMVVPVTSVVDEDLVGMGARVQELIEKLEMGSDGVRMIGILGGPGTGKSTLASSLSREISSFFEGHCTLIDISEKLNKHGLTPRQKKIGILGGPGSGKSNPVSSFSREFSSFLKGRFTLEDISEKSNKHDLIHLQKKIISSLLKKEVELEDVDIGKCEISELSCRNVLVILDGVDDIEQLEALAGSPHWFGSGSRIIITTENEHLLTAHKVDHVHPIRLLSNEEAIQLFNKIAYNEKNPLEDYHTLSLQVVSHFDGIPILLIALGIILYHQDKKGWRSFLNGIDYPPITYEGLKSELRELRSDVSSFWDKIEDPPFTYEGLKSELKELRSNVSSFLDKIEDPPFTYEGLKSELKELRSDVSSFLDKIEDPPFTYEGLKSELKELRSDVSSFVRRRLM